MVSGTVTDRWTARWKLSDTNSDGLLDYHEFAQRLVEAAGISGAGVGRTWRGKGDLQALPGPWVVKDVKVNHYPTRQIMWSLVWSNFRIINYQLFI